jgi:acyl-[acyl-carrier-protein]-phospholipid O-acyltransferase/long-chain-fatty-acid--[acyl-carrier-protein] ligase
VVTFFALHAFGRVPTMLNFTAGLRNLKAACKLAKVKRVLTAHKFIELGKLHDIVDALEASGDHHLSGRRARHDRPGRQAVRRRRRPVPAPVPGPAKPSDRGVVLFTSGSFGAPRGVVLSQANLVTNAQQIAAHIALDPDWVFFNPLPVFHCFGLTGGVILPILKGMKAFQYPSPLHTKQIPALVKDTGRRCCWRPTPSSISTPERRTATSFRV